MSATKLRMKPIAEQIRYYEVEIMLIERKIAKGKETIAEHRRHIRLLQKPQAQASYERRLAQHNEAKRKEIELEQRRERMAREVEECLRMNGKMR